MSRKATSNVILTDQEDIDRCKITNATLMVSALLLMGMITLLIEFTRNVITSGVIISTVIIIISLIYFAGLFGYDLWYNYKHTSSYKWAYILLGINICINIGAMIAFMSMFFSSTTITKINKKEVLSSLNPTVNGFLVVLCLYIFLNYYIYSEIRCKSKYINVLIVWLIMFASSECIIQILLLIMINSYIHKITDG